MFLVGLTGGIASGKSTVSSILKSLGIEIIDADQIAREVVEPGTDAWKEIKKEFGSEVLLDNGEINRPLLGQIVFSDAGKRKILNSITHPRIHKAMMWKCMRLFIEGNQFAVLDVPLLYESKTMLSFLHKVIVVKCEPQQQFQRLIERNAHSEEEARQRIDSQMPLQEKCKLADFVIDNSGSLESTQKQVADVVEILRASKAHWKLRAAVLTALLSGAGLALFAAFNLISRL